MKILSFYVAGKPSPAMNDLRTPGSLFLSFLTEAIIAELVLHTNERISEERYLIGDTNRNSATYSDTSINEMKAMIGTLLKHVHRTCM